MMLSQTIRLGRVFGIPVGIHYSWFVVFLLATFLLATGYYPDAYDWPQAQYWGVAVATSLLFFASVLAHELGHSLVALRSGVEVKSITLFVFGGVARIARDAPRPLLEFLIAIAGPLVSVTLGLLFLGIYFLTRDSMETVAGMALYLGRINLVVAIFNMIPAFPMDGGRVFRSIVWGMRSDFMQATRVATYLGRGFGFLFIGAGIAYGILSHNPLNAVWPMFIGWFLQSSAAMSYKQLEGMTFLRGIKVADVMAPAPPLVPGSVELRGFAESFGALAKRRLFLVGEDGVWQGVVSERELQPGAAVGQRLADVMRPRALVPTLTPSDDLWTAAQALEGAALPQLPVLRDGVVVGLVGRDSVQRSEARRGA